MRIDQLNDLEAMKLALEIERNGVEFYSEAMRGSKDETIREMFRSLAEDEKQHIIDFEAMIDEFERSPEQDPWDNSEVGHYIRNLVRTGVFEGKVSARIIGKSSESVINAISIGIMAEKDSILFYSEAGRHARDARSRSIFEKLEDVERQHLQLLTEKLGQMG